MVSLPKKVKDLFVYKEENMASLIKDRICNACGKESHREEKKFHCCGKCHIFYHPGFGNDSFKNILKSFLPFNGPSSGLCKYALK